MVSVLDAGELFGLSEIRAGGDEEEHGAVEFFFEGGFGGDLVGGGGELFEALEGEARLEEGVDGGGEGSVVFEDTLGEPVGAAFAFEGVAGDGPGSLAPVFDPGRVGGGHEDRVFDGEDEGSAGGEGAVDHADEAVEVADVVEREGAEGEVEGLGGKLEGFEVGALVDDGGVGGVGAGARDHVGGEVDAEDGDGALLAHPAGGPAEAAAQVDDALAA